MRNKRQFKRFGKKLQIEFATNATFYTGATDDISLNGLFIRTEHKFGLSTILIMVIHLAEGQASRLKGKVMRVKKYGIGLRLREKTPQTCITAAVHF